MPYAERDELGNITGLFVKMQPGRAEELLADDAAEVLSWPSDWAQMLHGASPAQVEAFVRNRVNAAAAVDLASARACLTRMETALVTLAKLLVFRVQV